MTRRLRMGGLFGAVVLAVAAHMAVGAWLWAQPVALPSDDALNFVRGLVRFSVLEFSPHFPGYPGFIALGRLVWTLGGGEPEQALFLTSVLTALALPVAAAWLGAAQGGGRLSIVAAYGATALHPLLPVLGVGMLSDGSGILFLLLFLAWWSWGHDGAGWGSGACLGLALCCRPSLGVMIVVAGVGAMWLDRRRAGAVAGGAAVIACLGFGAVLAWEGPAYVQEGWRFLAGHSSLWGQTALSGRSGWLAALRLADHGGAVWGSMVLCLAAIPAALMSKTRSLRLAGITLLAGLVWTIPMQNPDNLRHLAPLALLGGVIIAALGGRGCWDGIGGGVSAGLNAVLLFQNGMPIHAPPLTEAADFFRFQPPGVVITQNGVNSLRSLLPEHRIVDAYYQADAVFVAERSGGPVWRIYSGYAAEMASGDGRQGLWLSGRVPGEAALFIRCWDARASWPGCAIRSG